LTSRNGAARDPSNLVRLLAVERQSLTALSSVDAASYYGSTVSAIGVESRRQSQVATAEKTLVDSLEAERDAISGVSVDEEMVKLLEVQRSFEAAARYLNVVNELLDTLMRV
jgi:flagellar hook-associated protein 1 FlgK